MAKVTYDIDSSGGLMEQIQKLINPSEESRKKHSENTRRGGRVVSKEACDSCGEGGDLLCCDKCFAAFHLLCHDPPLNEDDVPYGEWLCRQCRSVTMSRGNLGHTSVTPPDDAQSTTSSKSNRSSVNHNNQKQRGQRKGGASSSLAGRATPETASISRADLAVQEESTSSGSTHPLSRLARDWRNLNPREFSLPIILVPNDLEPCAPIGNGSSNGQSDAGNPGSSSSNNPNKDKRQRISTYAATLAASSLGPAGSSSATAVAANMGPPHGGQSTPNQNNSSRRRSALPIPAQASSSSYDHQLSVYHSSGPPPAKKPVLEPDGNVVNLQPLILCYVCSRSCRVAPLLQCDYCPLAFHLDCLETPLATFPSSPWMCPNHPEHYLDVAFAPESRQSLSKRIRLWRHYIADMSADFNAIKLRFLNKLHRPTGPYRSQVAVVPVGSATSLLHVPLAVKEVYATGVDPEVLHSDGLFDNKSDRDYHFEDGADAMPMLRSFRQNSSSGFSSSLSVKPSAADKKKEISVLPSVVEAIMSVVDGKALPSDVTSRLDSQTILELARQRLEQLAPVPSPADVSFDAGSRLALKALMELSNSENNYTAEEQLNEALAVTKKLSARALFVPLERGLATFPISSKCISIGSSSKCGICLNEAVTASGCSRVSSLHGNVTYDELTDTYELLVYSEHGAIVDGVRYGVGQSSTCMDQQNDTSRHVATESSSPTKTTSKCSAMMASQPCHCLAHNATGDDGRFYSFDGPALLRHGSIVQIGCLRFVFARILLADVKRVVAELSTSVADSMAMEIS